MSSATSTSRVPPAEAGRYGEDVGRKGASEVRATPAATEAPAFRAAHFFILASLVAATGAVIMSRQSTPEHLVLISITIASAGLAAAGFYRMLSPLVSAPASLGAEPLSDRARAVFEREKGLTMRALKDLEFDRAMDKVSQADFDEMTGRLRARVMLLMKQLDKDGSGYRAIIERELSVRLAGRAADPPAAAAPPAPAAAGLCACGTSNDPDALFCKRCGTKLADRR